MNRKQKLQKKYQAPSKKAVLYKPPKVDMKYADFTFSASVTNSGSISTLFNNMVRGDSGLNNHDGNTIQPKYVKIDYYWNTQQTYNSVRLMVFQWFDVSIPSIAGLLQSTTTGIATISPILIGVKQQIRVLADHMLVLSPTAGGDTTPIGHGVHQGSIFIPERKLKPVRFNATANAIQDGNLLVLVVSDDAVPNYPACTLYSRVGFTD